MDVARARKAEIQILQRDIDSGEAKIERLTEEIRDLEWSIQRCRDEDQKGYLQEKWTLKTIDFRYMEVKVGQWQREIDGLREDERIEQEKKIEQDKKEAEEWLLKRQQKIDERRLKIKW